MLLILLALVYFFHALVSSFLHFKAYDAIFSHYPNDSSTVANKRTQASSSTSIFTIFSP